MHRGSRLLSSSQEIIALDGPREAIIQEEEFRGLLAQQIKSLVSYLRLLMSREASSWAKRHLAELVVRAHETESFLDDYNARNNKRFAYLVELIASARGFGRAAVALRHLVGRFPRYDVVLAPEFKERFLAETQRTQQFLDNAILALMGAILAELKRVDVPVATDAWANGSVPEEEVRRVLPHSIDEEDVFDEGQRIAEVATQYLAACDRFTWAGKRPIEGVDQLKAYVLRDLDEERSRYFESLVHSIESKYDTYVASTAIEARTPGLRRLRGHASTALHLLEVGTELVHFYVRHENDVRAESVKAEIARVVDKGGVLDRAANYAFFFASRILSAGRAFADEALSAFVRVQDLEVALPQGETLHARPISLIVKIVKHHGTHVEMQMGKETCSAASIMEIIMVAGDNPDARRIRFRGDARVLEDIGLLFDCGLGERGLDKLPQALSYLMK